MRAPSSAQYYGGGFFSDDDVDYGGEYGKAPYVIFLLKNYCEKCFHGLQNELAFYHGIHFDAMVRLLYLITVFYIIS